MLSTSEPKAGQVQKLYNVSAAGINFADTHHREEGSIRTW